MPQSRMAHDLLELGVRPGGVLLVHSSLRSLGLQEAGGHARKIPEAVILGLLEAIGPQGTLLMPALSYESVNAQHPFFDVRSTPSCVGALTEYFRTRPGTFRSLHPTHSVCGVGRNAVNLLTRHHLDTTPCGSHSPFAQVPEVGGQILFLGCGLRPNTCMHAVEEHVIPPYLYGGPVDYTVTQDDGSQISMRVTRHNFKGYIQRYDRLEDVMTRGLKRGLKQGFVLQADCYLLDAAEMWLAAITALRENPLFFVDKRE